MEFLSVIDILLEIFKWCESVDVLGFSDWFSCWINFSMASQLYHATAEPGGLAGATAPPKAEKKI